MKSYNSNIDNIVYFIVLINTSLSPVVRKIRRRNHRQEAIVLLIYYLNKKDNGVPYKFVKDLFIRSINVYNFWELTSSLQKSKIIYKQQNKFYLTDKGRVWARQLHQDIKKEYNEILKLYRTYK